VFSENRPYLQAWCTTAKAQRTFRLDRMLAAELGQPLPTPDVTIDGTERGDDTGSDAPRPTMVTVRIRAQARWLLDSYAFDPATRTETAEDGWIQASLPVWDREWFLRLVLSQGGDLVCEEPSEWRTEIARLAHAALAVRQFNEDLL
jgi:proteasome accessory factor C